MSGTPLGYICEMRQLVGKRRLMTVGGVVIIFDEADRVLLTRRADDGRWIPPGGLMEPGELLEEATRREVREEIGLQLGEMRLLGVASGPEVFHTYPNGDMVCPTTAIYLAAYTGQPLTPDPAEVLDIQFFALGALPEERLLVTDVYLRHVKELNLAGPREQP